MAQDELNIEILTNGDVKVTTDKISPANHMTAEGLIAFLSKLLGGESKRTRRNDVHHHGHEHHHEGEEEHEHQ
jgi:hypothetical protein